MNESWYDERENFYRTDDESHAENENGTDGDGSPGCDHANVLEKAWLSQVIRKRYISDT